MKKLRGGSVIRGLALVGLVTSAFVGSCSNSKHNGRVDTDLSRGVERGKYLVHSVALCTFCHSEIDWKAEGFPPREGTLLAGRNPFSEAVPWLVSPNLTPDRETGGGAWTDAQWERSLRQGVRHDGTPLHPVMPYDSYHSLSDDDLASIVAYLRSVPPVKKALPPTKMPQEFAQRLAALPETGRVEPPDVGSPVHYGEYLARLAICSHCHTPLDPQGKPIPGMEFAGGTLLKGPWGEVAAANITRDHTGLAGIKKDAFIHVMRTGDMHGEKLNAIMPWGYYRGMSHDDLRAIFAYLKSVAPVAHEVDNSEPPTPCRKCGGRHGAGNKNG